MERLLLGIAFSLLCAVSYGQIISDFATNDDGWTADGFAPGISYTTTGGNPNGFVSAQTPGSIVLGANTYWFPYHFYAPSKFAF